MSFSNYTLALELRWRTLGHAIDALRAQTNCRWIHVTDGSGLRSFDSVAMDDHDGRLASHSWFVRREQLEALRNALARHERFVSGDYLVVVWRNRLVLELARYPRSDIDLGDVCGKLEELVERWQVAGDVVALRASHLNRVFG